MADNRNRKTAMWRHVEAQHVAPLSAICILMLCAPATLSAQNGVAVTNLLAKAGTVTFDVSWPNTGMPAVWSDSVWVWVDYSNNGAMERLPLLPGATLTATSAPGVGTVLEVPGNDKGVWVVGNARSTGSFSASVKLLTAVASATGVCAYASNYRPLGDYISATHLSFTGTAPYDIVLKHTGGGSTMVVRSGSDFYVPAGYTVQTFSDRTGAPGVFTCAPMTGNVDFSVTPATVAKGQPVTFDVAVAPTTPAPSAITYTWSAPDFTPASHTGTPFSATAPAVAGNYPVTLAARSTGYCDLTKSKNVAVDCTHPATFTLTASASSFCAGSAGVAFGLSGTEQDRYYQLYRGAAPVAILTGTGSAATFSETFAVAGVYTARSIADGLYCTVLMGGSHTVLENALPAAPVISLPADVCQNVGDIEFTATGYTGALEWVSDGGGAVSGNTVTFTSGVPGVKTVDARSKLAYSATLTCYSSTVTASATVNALPAAPVLSRPADVCQNAGDIEFTATGYTGALEWVSDGGGAVSGNTVTFTSGAPGVKTVEARSTLAYATLTCYSSTVTASATVNLLPAGPTSFTSGVRCGAGTVTISATPPPGTVIDWYDDPWGGTLLLSGSNSYTTPSISTNTVYYAQVRIVTTGCVSASRMAVFATVNPLPDNPTVTPGARCGAGTVTVSASSSGAVIEWYSAAVGGTLLSSGNNSYTTPSITASATYYARAANTVTGCVSARVPVPATINTVPAISGSVYSSRCGAGTLTLGVGATSGAVIDWYDAAVGGTLLSSGANTYTTTYITTSTTYYAQARMAATGCTSAPRYAVLAIINALPANPTVTPGARCGAGTVTLSATPPSGAVIDWYSAAVGGTLLRSGNNNYTPSISTSTTYYAEARIAVTNGYCVSARVPVEATVNPLPADPTATHNGVCDAGTVALSATPPSGAVIDWYAASSGGTALVSGNNSYTTPSITTNTTYYAQARIAATGCVSARVPVEAMVVPRPADPTVTPGARCGPGTVTLSATTSSSDAVIGWYYAAVGGPTRSSGNNYTTPSIATSTTYYAQAWMLFCSSARVPVVATVNPIPTITRTGGNAQSMNQFTAMNTITYTGNNATSIALSSGGFPTGVSGTANGNVYTISGTPEENGAFTYSVTAHGYGGCTSAASSGTITVSVSCPPDGNAMPTPCAKVGPQIWSGPRAISAGCSLAWDLGTYTNSRYYADNSVPGSGYFYNWVCVDQQAATLCPSPWRVPNKIDFCDLVSAPDRICLQHSQTPLTQAQLMGNAGFNAWGGVYGGLVIGQNHWVTGATTGYWSSDDEYYPYSMYLGVDPVGSIEPFAKTYYYYGFQVRCVK